MQKVLPMRTYLLRGKDLNGVGKDGDVWGLAQERVREMIF